MANILLVEDSLEAQFLTRRAIEKTNNVDIALTLHEAREKITAHHFDMILLDVTLPDGDGMQFCSELEAQGVTKRTPIIMLTAKGDVTDKVQGLASGADDYIAKPFDPRELQARVQTILRRRGKQFDGDLAVGPITISLEEQKAYRKNDQDKSIQIDLTPIEFKILLALAKKPSETITREDLFEHVWGKGIHLSVRNIDTHVCKLRQKIGETNISLRSARGKGYMLVLPLQNRVEVKKNMNDFVLPQGVL